MNPEKEKQIVNVIDTNKKQGLSFYQTKVQLLNDGFTEADIVYAMYSDPYYTDNKPKQPHLLDDLYQKDPERAQAVAQELLQTQRQIEYDKTVADVAASAMGPDIQSRSYYEVLAADRLGIPFFTLFLGDVILAVVAIALKWSRKVDDLTQIGYGIFVCLIFAYKLFQERRQIKKK